MAVNMEYNDEQLIGWECPTCTFINFPKRPGCEQCSTNRPDDYQIPNFFYHKSREEIEWEKQDEKSYTLFHVFQEENRNNYIFPEKRVTEKCQETNCKTVTNTDWLKVIEMENEPVTCNEIDDECPCCLETCLTGTGIKLKDCFHIFCKPCLQAHIRLSDGPSVQCPTCESTLQEREIRSLVGEDGLAKYHARCVSKAENSSSDLTYHCKRPNCHGWCYYEENVDFFFCQVCQSKNCINCRAIHAEDCKTYQENVKKQATWDSEAKITQDFLQELINKGEAMPCPRCKIVITKKEGCDWICCCVCRLEICWVTKGPRWGPNGQNDTSGGCKCRINGNPCHADCVNCH